MSSLVIGRSLKYRRFHFRVGRHFSTAENLVVHVPKSNIYRFGDSNIAPPVFRDFQWTIKEGESWAVIGSGSGHKTALLEMLLGHLRISPPPPIGLFPFLSHPSSGAPRDPHDCVSLVSFAHRPRSSGGAFYDYTARYGAVREEDRITLRQSMFSNISSVDSARESDTGIKIEEKRIKEDLIFEELVEKLELKPLLDLPLVALSNGQTRRARIVKAVLTQPELLLLDEPLTGLDVNSRPTLLSLLHSLHITRRPRVIMGLRKQDPIPEWVSHIAIVQDGSVVTGRKEDVLAEQERIYSATMKENREKAFDNLTIDVRAVLIDMENVNVGYDGHERKVLKNINWKIREGERWHLQGANGSGKTTLLSLVTGDHPQSYTQIPPVSRLVLFDRPRSRTPTAHLRQRIGVVSPELFNAFPRRGGMTVWEAIGTGFDGGFVPLGKDNVGIGLDGQLSDETRQWRVRRISEVLMALGPSAWETRPNANQEGKITQFENPADQTFAARAFTDLSVAEQSMVLLMRALVGQPQLVLLDEVWSGMDDRMVRAARAYLRHGAFSSNQAVVVISHWEDEVPWGEEDGVKRFRLERGEGKVVKGSR